MVSGQLLVILCALVASSAAWEEVLSQTPSAFLNVRQLNQYWASYKLAHGKAYSGDGEEATRKKVFGANVLNVMRHNLEADLGLKSFKLAVNKYADLTAEEFRMRMGFHSFSAQKLLGASRHKRSPKAKAPASIDWRTAKNPVLVGPIQDQGQCGSCWAFSTACSIEAAHAKATGTFVKLSEQNLVDCARGPDWVNAGCQGGIMSEGFDYVIRNNGINTEVAYPYEAKDLSCRFKNDSEVIGATLKGFVEIDPNKEDDMRDAIWLNGPISVAIDASSYFFQLYDSGVYDDFFCSSDSLNHGVILVGYGTTTKGTKYWILRNSWSEEWGDKGYMLMRRGKNVCGVAEMASYPIAAEAK